MCHGVHGYLHCWLWLMSRQRVSRDTTRTRERLNTIQRDMYFKRMQYVIVSLYMISICATKPHQKQTGLGISPLHNWVFALFDTLRGKFHEFHFDNFYMSATFSYKYFTQQSKNIKVQGMCHVGGKGALKEVIQNEMIDKNTTWLVTCFSLSFIIY